MATLVLTTVGTLVGGPIGGAIGAVVGQSLDAALFAPKPRDGPRLGDLAVQVSSYGAAIPKLFGMLRVAGTVIWSTDLIERRATSGGGKGRPKSIDYSYSASFAVALSARPIIGVRRIWADGKLLRGAAGDFKTPARFRLHAGDEDQPVDPLIAAAEGTAQAPAFRGVAYAMFEDLQLADYGNRIPSLTFEVAADADAVTLAQVAAELSGGTIAAGAAPLLAGFAAGGGSVRGAIEGLSALAGLSLRDGSPGLVLGAPTGPAVAIDAVRELAGREVMRRAASSVPAEVSLAFHDVARDYQAGLQRASSGAGPGQRSERRGVPAALDAEAAKALAERRLAALTAGRTEATLRLGWHAATLRPGRLVTISGESGTWRIARQVIGPMTVRLDLVRVAGAIAATMTATPGRPVSEPDRPHGATILRLHDLPLGDGRDRPFVAALAGGGAGWRRAQLSVSMDQGASWTDAGATAAPAVLGHAATVLAEGETAAIDAVNAVEVELLDEEAVLMSRDADALVGGANLALIGGELVQFGQAEQIGPARWRLSRLLRGRRGTEWAVAGHVAGDAFALIETEALAAIDVPGGVGGGVALLASGVGDADPAEAALTVSGEALRPPNPVHLATEALADGGLLLRWVRRSRLGWSWTSGADTPLGEESEHYRLTLQGAGFSRTLAVDQSQWTYPASERAADGSPVTIEVAQIGTHAASRPAYIIV